MPATRYRITPRDPHAHLFEVACIVEQPDRDGQRLRLPAWIPGSYLIREFARHVVHVRAECDGRPVRIVKESKDTWRAARCTGTLVVTADVYAFDLSVRTAYLDGRRAFFNGSSVFLCPEGREKLPCIVDIEASPATRDWRVATTLPRDGAPPWGYGRYRAADYDELVDHPVEIADFAHVAFEAGGATHDVVVSGRHEGDLPRLAQDLARICQWQADLFHGAPGGRAPFDRYLFLVAVVGDGYGGLEHRASTALIASRNGLPRAGVARVDDDYRSFLGLASHEYFHSWNVKRIKPAAFVPYDLAREAYTRQLWAFEGFTSYYDDLALVRSGVIDVASWLELAGRTISTVLRTPGRRLQSVAESSFDAWIKYYRQDENSPNAVVSYYTKGAVVGMALDLTLREAGSSLDELMRTLWKRFGQAGVGVPEDGIAKLASELAGRDLASFFARFVDGIEDPPLAELLAGVGIRLRTRPALGTRDRGGTRGRDDEAPRATLGAKVAAGAEARLQFVFADGPAQRAGLAAGDVVIAADGIKVGADGLDTALGRRAPGDRLALHVFRRDELMTFDVTLGRAEDDTCWLAIDADAAPDAMARRKAWLGA
ncbi:MAG TPA: PDZ domain-containing protein [Casimicrobiaceae bacterium]|nr:PDZ domain-containing protein [Casimicrobiaceae bacterium]